jgi:radical SAM protein with 4Fe4S-binding SPASM domain
MKIDELRAYAYAHNLPLDVNIELGQNCNFKCPHCYCPGDKSVLPSESVNKIIDKCYQAGVLFINFTGGEALIRKDFPSIYSYAKSLGFMVSLQTNLSLLTDELKTMFVSYKPKHIAVTLYGTSEEEYQSFTKNKKSHAKVVENLDFLYQNDIEFKLKAVLTKETYPSVLAGRYAKLAAKYGKTISYDGVIFGRKDGDDTSIQQRLTPNEIVAFERSDCEGAEYWDDVSHNACGQGNIRCGGGISSFSIDALGYASICSLYISEKFNFIEQDFGTVWRELNASQHRMQMNYKDSQCSECNKKSICRWCSAYAVLEHGNPRRPVKFMCDLAEARISASDI